jgi:lauroyl/myristoyl acyltransferase
MKTYYLFRVASWLSRVVPARVAYWLCSLLGGLLFYMAPSMRRAVMSNMKHVLPTASVHVRRAMARRVIRNVLKNYYDLVRLPHLKAEELERMITVRGIEHLEAASARGEGVIVTSGHIGNFSIVTQIAAIRGFKVAIVAEDVQPPQLYDYVNHLRGSFGIQLIKTGSQVRTLYRFLRENGMLMLAADRDVTEGGEPVQFFDALADLPPGPVVLAARLNVPMIPAHTVRLPNNTSIVNIYPPLELQRTGDNERDKQANLRLVARVLEEMIHKAPDQWVVLQRVWDHEERQSAEPTAEPAPVETVRNEERSPSSILQ